LHWNSFTPEAKAKLLKDFEINEIKEEVNFHKISNLIKELNFKLLIREFSSEDNKELSKLKNIESELKIKEFRDYGRIQIEDYKNFFEKHFNKQKTEYYSYEISKRAKKFNDALDKFGIAIGENN